MLFDTSQWSRRRILGTFALAFWWPAVLAVGLLALPLYLVAFIAVNSVNFLRASRWRVGRLLRLWAAVVDHVTFLVLHAPLFASVAWYYVLRAPRDNVRKGVPYTLRLTRKRPLAAAEALMRDGAAPAVDGASGLDPSEFLKLDVYHHGHGRSRTRSSTNNEGDSAAASPTGHDTASTTSTATGGSGGSAIRRSRGRRPVVVFVYGGAWGSGSRWYYSKVAASLRGVTGAVVVVPDYDPYPANGMAGMVIALHRTLQWVQANVAQYGGDPTSVCLAGHSAGAHLAALYCVYRGMAQSGIRLSDLSLPLNAGLEAAATGCGNVTDAAQVEALVKTLTETQKLPRHYEPIPLLTAVPVFSFKYPTPIAASDPEDVFRALGAGPDGTLSPEAAAALPPIAGAVLFSGCYDVPRHVLTTETRRCVELISPASGAPCGHWASYSPTILLDALHREGLLRDVVQRLPVDFTVYHPINDSTVTIDQSEEFVEVLNRAFPEAVLNAAGAGASNPPHSALTLDRELEMGSPRRRDAEIPSHSAGSTETDDTANGLGMGGESADNTNSNTTDDERTPFKVHLMPRMAHADVVIGPMLQERPMHPTFVAIARAVHAKHHRAHTRAAAPGGTTVPTAAT